MNYGDLSHRNYNPNPQFSFENSVNYNVGLWTLRCTKGVIKAFSGVLFKEKHLHFVIRNFRTLTSGSYKKINQKAGILLGFIPFYSCFRLIVKLL